jgi:uncharacterized protein (DUF2164 family)
VDKPDRIELKREDREHCVRRLKAYFERERDEEIGDLGATLLYDYIAEQLAPFFYNEGLRDAQSLAGRAYATLDEDIEATKRITAAR